MTVPNKWALVGLAGAVVVTGALLLPGSRHEASQRLEPSGSAPVAQAHELEASGSVPAHETCSKDESAVAASLVAGALRAASPAIRAERAARDGRALEEELLALGIRAPRGRDLMELRARLERLLARRPELAPAAARAFLALEDRETLFAISRALVLAANDPAVRSALLEATGPSEPEARREVALMALSGSGDPALVQLERSTLGDGAAPASVRAAAAFALSRDWDALEPTEGTAALSAARAVGAEAGASSHLRAEALHLVARSHEGRNETDAADLALARSVLAEPGPDELALAAARLALLSGEDRNKVARALVARGTDPRGPCALAASTLSGGTHVEAR